VSRSTSVREIELGGERSGLGGERATARSVVFEEKERVQR